MTKPFGQRIELRFEPLPGATPIDGDEILDLIPSLSTQEELNEFEAANIAKAVQWCRRSRLVRTALMDVETWRRIHREMFGETWHWAGRFRLTEKSIGIEPFRISVELRNLRDDILTWQKFDTYPVDEIAIRFHHRLVQIHPFSNGNGRHARLVTDLVLIQRGVAPFTWGSADPIHTGHARDRYLESLRAADQHDYRPLTDFVRT